MSDTDAAARVGRVEFTGSRQELLGIMLRGYLLMVPTLGLYRFWQATWKRRFYWQNTVIDGEPIEYTGHATQLLIGFFFALAFFLPIYLALFYLSMQDTNLVLIGYGLIAAVIWFLSGYAIYRARDFRLSRTLWRGIRFDQKGSAWAYAVRRFLWSFSMVLTLGLIYPWMASSLWRYRYNHTWYGDRQFDIGGNWRVFAGPWFGALVINLIAIGFTVGWIVTTRDFVRLGNTVFPGPIGLVLIATSVLIFGFTLAWFRARTASRMLSTVTIGDARLVVRLSTARLFGQYAGYIVAFVGLMFVLAVIALVTIGVIYGAATAGGQKPDPAKLFSLFQSGTLNVALLIAAYLVVLGAFGLMAEIVLGFGWWRLLARGSSIANPDSLRSVRAVDEDRSLIGEGLADALNVGAY